MGGGKAVTIGYRYTMDIHMGFGRGPFDSIVEIRVGDKMAWPIPGGQSVLQGAYPSDDMAKLEDTGTIRINAYNLFGGDRGEGGVQGDVRIFMGKPDQVIPDDIKVKMGGDVPEFRGVVTGYFSGIVCALNPYPKTWKVRVRRAMKGWDGDVWYPEKCKIPLRNGAIIAMNPAHMMFECATNRDWGRGFARTRINDASFRKAADQLYREGFGLCFRYNRQDSLKEFVSVILNTVNATLYTSRETGLLCFDLIRDDYDPTNLPTFDYETGLLSVNENESAAREDTVNEVIVKYQDPTRNEQRSVRVHNLASLQSSGVKNSSTVEYPAIPVDGLAALVASRDLKTATLSGTRYTIVLDRRAWKLVPGSVFRISAPDRSIANLILRAGKVSDPNVLTGEITIVAVPDIFGLPATAYAQPQVGYWQAPDRLSSPPRYQYAREATYRDIFLAVDAPTLAMVNPAAGHVLGMATKPTSLSQSVTMKTKTSSETDYVERDTDAFSPTFMSSTIIGLANTSIGFNASFDVPSIGNLPCAAQIEDEIIRIDAITYDDATQQTGTLTVARGCVDTFPTIHAANKSVILFDRYISYDGREYAQGEVVSVALLTNTSATQLAIADAAKLPVTVIARQGKPYAAANVKFNDVSIFGSPTPTNTIKISWAHRDRLMQQDVLVGWFQGTFNLEPGVTYTLQFFDANKLYRRIENLTADNYTYSVADMDADGVPKNTNIYMSLTTIRQGTSALQTPLALVRRT